MDIIPWKSITHRRDPFGTLEQMQREMNHLFDFSMGRLSKRENKELAWAPSADIIEEKNKVIVRADLPGMTKDQIEILVQNDILTIKGEKKEEKEVKEKNYIASERFYGAFHRSFSLPSEVDPQNVKATYKEGVLEVVLPKKEGGKPKQIKVDIQ